MDAGSAGGTAGNSAGAAAPYLVQRLGKGLEAFVNDREKLLARPRERHGPRAPSKQGLTAMALQQFQLMADRGRRDAQFGGGQLEAEVARGGLKRPKFGERRQSSHPDIIGESNSPST